MIYAVVAFALFFLAIWTLARASHRTMTDAMMHGARPDPRHARGQSYEAGALLTQGESLLMQGRSAEARDVYHRVLSTTERAGDSFSASEALYGLARIATSSHAHGQAVAYLERALSHAPAWRDEKPMFEQLLRRNLEEAQRRRDA